MKIMNKKYQIYKKIYWGVIYIKIQPKFTQVILYFINLVQILNHTILLLQIIKKWLGIIIYFFKKMTLN